MGQRPHAAFFYGYHWSGDPFTIKVVDSSSIAPEEYSDEWSGEHEAVFSDEEDRFTSRQDTLNLSANEIARFSPAWSERETVVVEYGRWALMYRDDEGRYLAIKAGHFETDWDDALEVERPAVDPEWRTTLDRCLEIMGIRPPQPEPKWWLVAGYG
jgi:hypothetical protein